MSQPVYKAAANAAFFTPAQDPPAGSAVDPASAPTLFKPIKIRNVELHNRFVVSPMCMYSADNGHMTDWHLVHLGQFALYGAGLICFEAHAVEPRGRISPQDAGLWQDSQVAPLKRVVDLIHSQNTKAAIQLGHAGRKAGTYAMWLTGSANKSLVPKSEGGWEDDVVGPSALKFANDHALPKELTVEEIKGLTQSFVDAAKRAVQAGFDVIEIHAAHGYLHTNFLSPLSNKRTDAYGGSFENRTRFLRETIQAVRAAIPESMPLWVRISATEWMEWAGEPSWDLPSTIRLAKELPGLGVDVLDVSSGGNTEAQKIQISQTFQSDLAREVRDAVRAAGLPMLVTTVGFVTQPEFARSLVEDAPVVGGREHPTCDSIEPTGAQGPASADLVQVGRKFLREPQFVLRAARDLKVPVHWPHQYSRGLPSEGHEW